MLKDRLEALKGKTALVMGAGKARIGNVVAQQLAVYGVNIAIHYNSSAQEAAATVQHLRDQGVRAEKYQADLNQPATISALVDRAVADFGAIDFLINTAAVYRPIKLAEVTPDDFRWFFAVNALGSMWVATYLGRLMKAGPGGVIVNIGDWASATNPYLDYLPYHASKAGIEGFTMALAKELAPTVRVNCLRPGPVLFPPDMPAAERQEALARSLLRREGSPENIALAALELLLNDFKTGNIEFVDGGRHLAPA